MNAGAVAGAATERKDPLVGQTLGGYVVKHFLGRGGMSVVYLAEQPDIGKAVAIKILKNDVVSDADQLRRLMEEARIVSSLHHRGIVDVFTFGTLEDGRPYLVMEFLEGEPLDGYLAREGRMSPEDAVAVLDEVFAAMAVAHHAGVVHRDLKPVNLFWAFDSSALRYIKILDFGLAKRSQQPNGFATQTAFRPAGTPEYMAPEQARGERVSPRSDLYSLGVTAFEMLTGDLPFKGATLFEILRQHMYDAPPRVSSREPAVPPSLDQLVAELLRKEPQARPPSADDVRRRLKGVAQELQHAGTRIGPFPTLRITEPAISPPAGPLTPANDVMAGLTPRNVESPEPIRDTAEASAFVAPTRSRRWLLPGALGLAASAAWAGWFLATRAAPVAAVPSAELAPETAAATPATPVAHAAAELPVASRPPPAHIDALPARTQHHLKAVSTPATPAEPTTRQVLDALLALQRQRKALRDQGGSLNRGDDTTLEEFRKDLSSPHPLYGLQEIREEVEHIRRRSGVRP
jgi:serine/threonine protein kinase